MKTNEHPISGIWYVIERENRVAGIWEREYEYAPGEWIIDFMFDGSFFEIIRKSGRDHRTPRLHPTQTAKVLK